MLTESTEKKIVFKSLDDETVEYTIVIDGVIDLPQKLDKESFFDGLLDMIIEYTEKYNAIAGLSMSHNEYVEEADGEERT